MENLVQIVNWSRKPSSQKIVQIQYHDKPYMLVGDEDTMHARLLKRFLEKQGVFYTTNGFSRTTGEPLPDIKGYTYIVAGMGFADLDFPNKKCKGIYGNSHDYGLSIDSHFKTLTEETLRQLGWKVR